MVLLLRLFLVVALVALTNGAKILGIFPLPGISHYNLEKTYMRALAEAGHDVTVISFFGEKDPPKNGTYRDIYLTGLYDELLKSGKKKNFFERYDMNPYLDTIFITMLISRINEGVLKNGEVQKLIHSGEKFDVVVVEQFLNDAMKAFASHFGAHLVLFSPVGATSMVDSLVGNISPASYVPAVMIKAGSEMNFLQRMNNAVYNFYYNALMQLYFFPKQKQLVQKYFPNPPPFDDILYNTSLVLVNGHESLNHAVPSVPNMVFIGGFHMQEPKKLPKDLQEYLDGAKEGVIYFSMGSNLQSKDMPEDKRDIILKVFGKLKMKVLWKWEADVLPGQPSNVKLWKWLPQTDLLAHPNVKMFITHGGWSSTTEAVYRGVPIITIPIYGDQEMNGKTAEIDGYGRVVHFRSLTEENFSNAIHEVLNNPKYKENAVTRSQIMKDRKVKPLDEAVYWTEYIIRHRGALHLRVAGLKLPWYKLHLLDVYAVLAIIILVSCFVIKKILCGVYRWLKPKKVQKQKKN